MMTRRGSGFMLACGAVVLVLVASACRQEVTTVPSGPAGTASETTLAECVVAQGTTEPAKATGTEVKTLKQGTLLVGSDTAYPPFESIEGGKAVGFDVDLVTEVAKRIGLTAEVQTASFDTIFTELAAGKFDAVISAVTIKEDRKKTVDFTDPYFKADQSLAVRTADAGTVKGVDNLKGKVVGVQSGTTGEDCAKTGLKDKGKAADVKSYDTIPAAFDDLLAGRIGAVLNDLPTSKRIVEQKQGLQIVQIVRTKEEYGIAVAKGNPNLRESINKALAAIRADGTYRTLFLKWFQTEPPS